MYWLQYFTWNLYVYSSSELHEESQSSTSNGQRRADTESTSNGQRRADTESTRQRTHTPFTRETHENNTYPFRQQNTQFISVSVKCINCNEFHQALLYKTEPHQWCNS